MAPEREELRQSGREAPRRGAGGGGAVPWVFGARGAPGPRGRVEAVKEEERKKETKGKRSTQEQFALLWAQLHSIATSHALLLLLCHEEEDAKGGGPRRGRLRGVGTGTREGRAPLSVRRMRRHANEENGGGAIASPKLSARSLFHVLASLLSFRVLRGRWSVIRLRPIDPDPRTGGEGGGEASRPKVLFFRLQKCSTLFSSLCLPLFIHP